MLTKCGPIDTRELFPPLYAELFVLLRSLSPDQWLLETPAPGWNVHAMAAHLLDTDLRRLASQRDGWRMPPLGYDLASYDGLLAYINDLNQSWVAATQRVSPRLLVDLMEFVGHQIFAFYAEQDLAALTGAGVIWAGERRSALWFDLAREYTEKWHHQQHIREAVGAPLQLERRWLYPALDTFLRGLPHAYRGQSGPDGSAVTVRILGEAGGAWSLMREDDAWQLYSGNAPQPSALIEIDQDSAWRLFTKGLSIDTARERARIVGDFALAEHFFGLLAIIA
jgi:uncharacterized Actinobacterial protein TIGR03083